MDATIQQLSSGLANTGLDEAMPAAPESSAVNGSSQPSRVYCHVPSCPRHDQVNTPGWSTVQSMRNHLEEHATGRLLGDIPQISWLRITYANAVCAVVSFPPGMPQRAHGVARSFTFSRLRKRMDAKFRSITHHLRVQSGTTEIAVRSFPRKQEPCGLSAWWRLSLR